LNNPFDLSAASDIVNSTWDQRKTMFDGLARRFLNVPLAKIGRVCATKGMSADAMTVFGFGLGLTCALAIALQYDFAALVLLALGRTADGLDGAIARATKVTDRGGYLDITLDFLFYGAVPLAFALRQPEFALPAAVLLASFYANGASFLAYSAVAAKRGMTTEKRGVKSLYFTTGLVEGAETIAFFVACILFPHWFPVLAYVFAGLCLITCLARISLASRVFGVDDVVN
jgi:phosphatidylglycerophosphate synthase